MHIFDFRDRINIKVLVSVLMYDNKCGLYLLVINKLCKSGSIINLICFFRFLLGIFIRQQILIL